MQRSKEKAEEPKELVENENEINKAKEALFSQYTAKDKQDIITSLLKTVPSSLIIEKISTFIKTVSSEPVTPI